MRRIVALALALGAAASAGAPQVVVSPAPEALSVSVYRDPERDFEGEIDLDWLGGYALVTETRTVELPAGDSEIRFEGVAGNILPASVIVRGLPAMPREKNYDARLLSAGSLIEASLGRQVHIRRTDRATGKMTEEEAIIRSGPDGVVLQTSAGFEALQCTGLAEALVYREVPPGLSAKPTLAIRAVAAAPTTAKLQLSYLATQFDWQANYVARLGKDGRTMDLFAWLTLANANAESFPIANVNAIAGYPNREEDDDHAGTFAPSVSLRCWPAGRTNDLRDPTLPPPPPPEAERDYDGADIVVTGSRIPEANFASASPVTAISAQQEDLGDLKLYRIPEPVTVAANGQKQVALLHKARVPVERLYRIVTGALDEEDESESVSIMLRARNSKDKGLGLPLPSGSVAIFEDINGESLLAGETNIDDLAIDEDVELVIGQSPDIRFTQRILSRSPKDKEYTHDLRQARMEIELTNATPERARVEVGLSLFGTWDIRRSSAKLKIVKGRKTWVADVPAAGRARLTYTVKRPKPRKEREDSDD